MSSTNAAVSFQYDTPELADAYERAGVVQFNHGQVLIERLRIAPGERVLDVGAGTGRLAAYVAELVGPAGEVVGIDPLGHRIAIAQSRSGANVRFATGQAEDLSAFADASFDVVYLNSVLHWIADKPRALAEAHRVLRPGGRIGLNTKDPSKPHEIRGFIQTALADAGLAGRWRDPQGGSDGAALQVLLEEAGFRPGDSVLHTIVDFHDNVDDLLTWSESSAFGNFLSGFSPDERSRIRAALAARLESRRTPDGLRLERYLRFATAVKPAAS